MKMEIGDRVNVFFDRVESELNVKILGIPSTPEDSWKLQRMDGTFVQIQNYEKMVRLGQPTMELKPLMEKALRMATVPGLYQLTGNDILEKSGMAVNLTAGSPSTIHAVANIGEVQKAEEEKPNGPEEDLSKKSPAPPESKSGIGKREESPFKK